MTPLNKAKPGTCFKMVKELNVKELYTDNYVHLKAGDIFAVLEVKNHSMLTNHLEIIILASNKKLEVQYWDSSGLALFQEDYFKEIIMDVD
jgi:hypothetical protein